MHLCKKYDSEKVSPMAQGKTFCKTAILSPMALSQKDPQENNIYCIFGDILSLFLRDLKFVFLIKGGSEQRQLFHARLALFHESKRFRIFPKAKTYPEVLVAFFTKDALGMIKPFS